MIQAEYEYNSLGQQVIRRLTQLGQTIHSIHDTDGNRIAEYLYDESAGTSSLIREYIWANGQVVGVFENGALYFVRTDHIGRPSFATDSSGSVVWEASYKPFGGVEATSGPNPALRFPGQWFQSETGLHQNWMRDYDPTTGRYMQADPLGLVDGASVYGYALQNPGRYVDPRGEFVLNIFGCLAGAAGGVFGAVTGAMIVDNLSFEEIRCKNPFPAAFGGCLAGLMSPVSGFQSLLTAIAAPAVAIGGTVICNGLHLSGVRIANIPDSRSNYLTLSGVPNSHYLRMRSDYVQRDCNHLPRITLLANSMGSIPEEGRIVS